MAKGLLLGNGVNAYLGIKDLSVVCIAERFRNNIVVYSSIIEKLFGVKIKEDFWESINCRPELLGIETLAGILYKYIKNRKGRWTDNDEYRMQDVIACVCLTSIFYTKNGKINQSIDRSKIAWMDSYDYIFTLNYTEFWDVDKKCIHLHEEVELSKLGDEKKALLISKDRMNLTEYAKSIENIKKTSSIIEFNPNEVIFAPEGIEKNKLVCVTGIFPSNKLFPADDLFFYRSKELYTELDKVSELDIFGMSPYGDDSIIDKINSKDSVRVYVYQKDVSEETKEWEKKLTCPHELLDSAEMK